MDPTPLLHEAGKGRRALKRLAARLDSQESERLALAVALGLPPEWPAKKLLRHGLERSAPSQVRRNPIRRDEAFVCAHCQREVSQGGARVRDHCPLCLYSLHVDRVPGDRAADCGGLLEPVGLDGPVILYRCQSCGHAQRNRAHDEDDIVGLARRLSRESF